MKFDTDLADDIIATALKYGADEAEVFLKSYKNISAESKNQAVEALSSSVSSGYSVRVVKNRRPGFSFSTDIRAYESVIRQAIDSANSADEDMNLVLPSASSEARQLQILDSAIENISEDDAIRFAIQIEKAAYAADSRITKVRKPSASFTTSNTIIANSFGLKAEYRATSCSAQITAIAEAGGECQSGWDFMGSRFLGDISFEQVGAAAAASAARLLGSRRMEGKKTDILVDNSVAVDFLGVFASSLSSEALQKGKSLLAGRLNSAIISPKINITDSGLLPGKLGSKPIDDEGVRTEHKTLVREGTLLSYLYNTYTAKKGNTASTGNAIRGSFASAPGVGITNLFIEPANPSDVIPKNRLFSSLNRGLYIVDAMGIHTVNAISGDFSIGVTGLWIENNEIAYPVKEAVISGNLLDFFAKVSALSDDLRFYGGLGSPSLIISDIDVSA